MQELILAANLIVAPIDRTAFNNPLIPQEPETVEIVEVPELTLEEKIAQNYYECDETIEYIRKDNAECLVKAIAAPVRATQSPNTGVSTAKTNNVPSSSTSRATAPSGWFAWNQCTGHVWSKRSVGQWNNASEWYWQAQRDGWATGLTPRVGAVGVAYGNHVVYIERVDGDRVYISERNYDGRGSYREQWTSASNYRYIY